MLQLSHKKLDVYILSLRLVKLIYKLTTQFPDNEKFGVTNQIRRASLSVVSNIAEGASRKSINEKKRFNEISRSSLVEIDTQLEVVLMLEYASKDNIFEIENQVSRIFKCLVK